MNEIIIMQCASGDTEDVKQIATRLSGMNASRVVITSQRNPIAAALREMNVPYETLDSVFNEAADFDDLADKAAHKVIDYAPCVYVVRDASNDKSVARILEIANERHENHELNEPHISVEILPGITEASVALSVSAATATEGVTHICAADFTRDALNPSLSLVITELTQRLASDVKLILLCVYPPDLIVTLGTGGTCAKVALQDIDRQEKYTHESWLHVPSVPYESRSRYTLNDLIAIVARLRDPVNGCPWDRVQTHETLREFILEEACEVIEAIELDDSDKMMDELGDVLLQIALHANIGRTRGEFDEFDVTTGICEKLIRRHPHIFASVDAKTVDKVLSNWDEIKKAEKKQKTTGESMRDIPRALPALMRANKVQTKASRAGHIFEDRNETIKGIAETLDRIKTGKDAKIDEDVIGDVLFELVSVSRESGFQPELALNAATQRFIERYEEGEGEGR